MPPVAGHEIDVEAQPPRDLGPAVENSPMSKASTRSPGDSVLTSDASQAPVPDAGKDHDRPRVWKIGLQSIENVGPERRELRAPVIDRRLRHRAQHAIGRVGRPGYLQKMSAAPMHGRTSYPDLSGLGARGSGLGSRRD